MNFTISRSALLIAGVVTLVVASLAAAVVMRSGRHEVYKNVEDGYEVTLPAAWKRRQLTLQDGRRIDVFASPNETVDQASCSIGSSDNDEWSGKTQNEINRAIASGEIDDKLESLVGANGGATLISSKHVRRNGLTAVIAVFSQEVTVEGQEAKMRTKVFVAGSPGRVRYVHCVAFESKAKEVDAEFDQLIASYKLI